MTDDDDTYGLGLIIFIAVVFIVCKLCDVYQKRASILPVYHEHRTVADSHQQAYIPARNTVNAGSARSVACVAPAPRVNPAFSATWTRTSDLVGQRPWVPPPTSQATPRPPQSKSYGVVNGGPSTLAPLHQYAIAANRASMGEAIAAPAPTHRTVPVPSESSTRVRSLASPIAQRYELPPLPSRGIALVDPKASGVRADPQMDGQVLQATYFSLENAEHLRARAKAELRKRKEMLKKARKERDAVNARAMRQISEMHEFEHKRLNQEAANVFFKLNNDGLPPSKVDLHKLTVDEAIKFARLRISSARENKLASITFITGKGIHSENNEARIKPALQKWLKEQKLVTKIQQKNEGRLVVVLETESEDVATAAAVAGYSSPVILPNVLITTRQSVSVTA